MIRIASALLLTAEALPRAAQICREGLIDFLVSGCTGEAVAARLQKQRRHDPWRGYDERFPEWAERLAPQSCERDLRVLTGAGGLNPSACARELRRRLPSLKVAVVTGEVTDRLDALRAQGLALAHLETAAGVDRIRDRILWAAAEVDAGALRRALATGAQAVITTWPARPALALAAAMLRFGWQAPDWNRLAAGAIAGHLSAGASRLLSTVHGGRQGLDRFGEGGCPVVELFEDGCFEIAGLGPTARGIDAHVVKEQLLSGVGDPRALETPDCTVDLTHLAIEEPGAGRLRIRGARGRAPAEETRLWIAYQAGWKATGALLYCWPDALEKARTADRCFRRRLGRLNLAVEEMCSEYLGVNACLGPMAPPAEDYAEVELRIRARCRDRASAEQLAREVEALADLGPPCAASPDSGPATVEEAIGFWPTRAPRSELQAKIEVVE